MPYPQNMTDDEAIQLALKLTESSKEKLRKYVERIEQLITERNEINATINAVYADAKALGFDTKALRQTIALRRKGSKKRQEEEMMIDLYMGALEGD